MKSKGADTGSKPGQNGGKTWQPLAKPGLNWGIFYENGGTFCRKSLVNNALTKTRIDWEFILKASKDLRHKTTGGPEACFRNPIEASDLRRANEIDSQMYSQTKYDNSLPYGRSASAIDANRGGRHSDWFIVRYPRGVLPMGARIGWAVCLLAAGCATTPPLDNPIMVQTAAVENPVLVSPGVPTPEAYREVFDKTVDILDDYFELLPPDPYDGRIVTKPRIAPGYEQFWKPGNPDARGRLLATFQTIRQTAVAEIRAGERGGILVHVVVDRELEDLSRPSQARIGNALFQDSPTVDRQLEVVGGETTADHAWFKVGRDYALEQEILHRIRHCR